MTETNETISVYAYVGTIEVEPNPLTLKIILEVVSRITGITIPDIISKCKKRKFVIPRQIYAHIACEKFNYKRGITLEAIGEVIDKDHATIMHDKGTCENDMSNPIFKALYRECLDEVNKYKC
jgi:chromosomal replication initiation ATPase DnaA